MKKKTIPPVLFRELYPIIDKSYHSILDELILLKSKHIEKSNEQVDASLIHLVKQIAQENNRVKNDLVNKKPNPEEFNEFFLKTIT